MSILTPNLPHAVPLPLSNPSSASSDARSAEGLVSSLSSSFTMASTSTTTNATTNTNASTVVTREEEEARSVTGRNEKSSSDEMKESSKMNEILISNASTTAVPFVHQDGQLKGLVLASTPSPTSQVIDFTAQSSVVHNPDANNPPYTPTSASASVSLAMPSPKSDIDAERTRTSTTTRKHQQHRKSVSVSGVVSSITLSNSNTITTAASAIAAPKPGFTYGQFRARSGSVQPQPTGRTVDVDTLGGKDKGIAVSGPRVMQQQPYKLPEEHYPTQQLLVNTPPEMLPPSPPLTNNELEMDDERLSEKDHDPDVDADVDVETDGDADVHTQSRSQTETSGVQDEDDEDDEDVDENGVNPQVEADIADGWQAPDSKLETTPGTPVLQSPSTTSLPSPSSAPAPAPSSSSIQETKFTPLSPTSPSRLLVASTLDDDDHRHPSSPSKVKIPPRGLDVDLEKGDLADYGDSTVIVGGDAKRRTSMEAEAETSSALGVTKKFEVIRSAKRFSSPKPPRSSYYIGPPTGPTAYGTTPTGQIGLHHPREVVRIERDYDHGELVQFSPAYPLELEGRITPTQFLDTINAINERLIRAHSLSDAFFFNLLAILTFWISPFFVQSTYKKEMRNLQALVDALNAELYNPQGLNILWPRRSAFLFLEIEYY